MCIKNSMDKDIKIVMFAQETLVGPGGSMNF